MDAIDHLALAEVALLNEEPTLGILLALESIRRARTRISLKAMVSDVEQAGLYDQSELNLTDN